MKAKHLIQGVVFCSTLLFGTTQFAQAKSTEPNQSPVEAVSVEEFREQMIKWAIVSENTYKPGEDLAVKIASLSDQQIAGWLALIENPVEFMASQDRTIARLQSRAGYGNDELNGVNAIPDEKSRIQSATPPLTSTFPPDYPPGSGAYYDTIISGIAGFGISGASNTNRCDASDWGDYVGVWWPLNKTFDTLDGACVVAGCDPIGIACAITCGILETAKIALKIAAVPLEACDIHQAAIDGAEIEATYENTLGLVGDVAHVHNDLTTHDTNIDGDLAAHDSNIDGDLIAHDNNIDGDLIVHNNNLNAHDANIDGDLIAHDNNIDGDLIVHNNNLNAHDANIDADLQLHDHEIKALLDGVQETLDEKVELRKVHMQVLQLDMRKRYLVTTKEAGIAVAVDFTSIEVFNEEAGAFQNLSSATATEIEPGLYDINMNLGPKSPDNVFRLRVRHDELYDHYGEIVFHRTSSEASN